MIAAADVAAAAPEQVATELRDARERVGMTQAQVAGAAGVALSSLRAIEAGAVPKRSAVLERVRAVLADAEAAS